MKNNFTITNITCDACIKISSMVLKKIPGVTSVEIDKNGKASIESGREITEEEITNALKEVEKTVDFRKFKNQSVGVLLQGKTYFDH